MSEQTANLETEQVSEAEYEEAASRALQLEQEAQRERNRQDYSMYVDETL